MCVSFPFALHFIFGHGKSYIRKSILSFNMKIFNTLMTLLMYNTIEAEKRIENIRTLLTIPPTTSSYSDRAIFDIGPKTLGYSPRGH